MRLALRHLQTTAVELYSAKHPQLLEVCSGLTYMGLDFCKSGDQKPQGANALLLQDTGSKFMGNGTGSSAKVDSAGPTETPPSSLRKTSGQGQTLEVARAHSPPFSRPRAQRSIVPAQVGKSKGAAGAGRWLQALQSPGLLLVLARSEKSHDTQVLRGSARIACTVWGGVALSSQFLQSVDQLSAKLGHWVVYRVKSEKPLVGTRVTRAEERSNLAERPLLPPAPRKA